MQRKNRALTVLLALLLICGISAAALGAALPMPERQSDDTPARAAVPSAAASAFTDVPDGAWYAEAANWCRENGIMGGTTDSAFSPEEPMTRAMLAVVLHRAAGLPAAESSALFTDAFTGTYYYSAVSWASENGYITGYGDGLFGTDDPVTREQLAAILWRYDGSPAAEPGEDFADEGEISRFAAQAVDWARASGIIRGTDGSRFDPAGQATRAQVSQILFHYLSDSAPGTDGPEPPPDTDAPRVFMTTDISPAGLMAAYEALDWKPSGKVAVKLSTGEPPASNYLAPALIQDVVKAVDGTIVECNTAYGGSRAETAMHYQVARDHGLRTSPTWSSLTRTARCPCPCGAARICRKTLSARILANYDCYLVLSHFKGHAMAGFGGAIKNISIGLGSAEGKCLIHTGGQSNTSPWGGDQQAFLESMGEAGKSVSDSLGNGSRIVYINVMNRLSIDCDCDGNPSEPDLHDIGILASTDPVALDQARIDLVYEQKDGDGASLVNRIESRDGLHTLEHAAAIGLGSREYRLVSLD